jgi:hypothetical protein
MKIGGIIAGALGGAAGAVREIGDTNLKLRQQEEAAAGARQQGLEDAQRQREWRREDALWEMDEKLKRLPEMARAQGEAAALQESILRDSRNKSRGEIEQGLISQELSGSVIADESTWTPEQEAVRQQGLAQRGKELRQEPRIRQQVGLAMGEITEKDIMADDRNRDIAQLRAEVTNAKTEMERQRAQDRLDNAIRLLNMRIDAGGVGPRAGGAAGGVKESDINAALNSWTSAEARARAKFRPPTEIEKVQANKLAEYEAERTRFIEQDEAVRAARARYEALINGGQSVGSSEKPSDNAGQRDPGPPRVNSKAELDKLPKGTRYVAPDGSVRIKQ